MSSEISSTGPKLSSSDDHQRVAGFWFLLTAALAALFAGAVFVFIL